MDKKPLQYHWITDLLGKYRTLIVIESHWYVIDMYECIVIILTDTDFSLLPLIRWGIAYTVLSIRGMYWYTFTIKPSSTISLGLIFPSSNSSFLLLLIWDLLSWKIFWRFTQKNDKTKFQMFFVEAEQIILTCFNPRSSHMLKELQSKDTLPCWFHVENSTSTKFFCSSCSYMESY